MHKKILLLIALLCVLLTIAVSLCISINPTYEKLPQKNAHANSGANNITQPSTETQPIDNRENPAEATPQSQPTCPSELQPTITSPVGKPTFPTVAPVMTTCSHVYEKIIVDPTCEKDGLCISACILCGLANASDLVPSLGHEFTFYTSNSDASCLTDGTKTSRCSRCDATDTMADVGSALGHSYSIWAICKPATCTEAGERKKTCSRCSFRKTEMISALGHADEPLVAKPTCTTAGYTTHICARCHRSYTDNSTPATGHLYGDWTIIQDPTEEENGYKKRACAFCSAVESQPIPALPHTHDYNTAVKKPSCTEPGNTTYTCRCGQSYQSEWLPASGHNYSAFVITAPPTQNANGEETAICNHCHHRISRTYICPHDEKYSISVPPTTEETGFIETKCKLCETPLQYQILAKLEYLSLNEVTPISPFSHLSEKTKSLCEALVAYIANISITQTNHRGRPVVTDIKLTLAETEQIEDALRLYYGCYYAVHEMLIFSTECIDGDWYCVRIYLDVKIAVDAENTRRECEAKYLEAYKTFTKGDRLHLAEQIFDYLETAAVYDSNKADIKNLLFESKGSCNAFSVAFRQMCLQLGIPCDMIAGHTQSGGYHAWNRIKSENGTWMYFDISFWKKAHKDMYRGGKDQLHNEEYFNSYE